MIYLLQKIYDYRDRQLVNLVKENAVYQVFCGLSVVEKCDIPVHQKVEEFRNRLTPETQSYLVNIACKLAVDLGLGDPSTIDVDATTQEANMTYPSDARLIVNLTRKVEKIAKWVQEKTKNFIDGENPIERATLLSKAKGYFFQAKNVAIEKRREAFHQTRKEAILSPQPNGLSY